jgi:hypothetical protein
MTVGLSLNGKIVGVQLGNRRSELNLLGEAALAGCHTVGVIESSQGKDKSVQFRKKLNCEANETLRELRLVGRHLPPKIQSDGRSILYGAGLSQEILLDFGRETGQR